MRYRRAWLDSADPSNQMPLTDVSLGDLFGWADLSRFQILPYRAYGSSSKERLPKSNPHRWRSSPLSRLQTAIESEKINLTGIYLKDHLRQPIKPPHLKDQIEYLMRRRTLTGPRRWARSTSSLKSPGRQHSRNFAFTATKCWGPTRLPRKPILTNRIGRSNTSSAGSRTGTLDGSDSLHRSIQRSCRRMEDDIHVRFPGPGSRRISPSSSPARATRRGVRQEILTKGISESNPERLVARQGND